MQFSGLFVKMGKLLLASSCLSVDRLSLRMEQLGSHWTGSHQILCLRVCRKSVEKIQV